MTEYLTIQGDTFDSISKKFYDSELLMDKIIDANQQYADVMVFEAGVKLSIPDATKDELEYSTLPPWRLNNE